MNSFFKKFFVVLFIISLTGLSAGNPSDGLGLLVDLGGAFSVPQPQRDNSCYSPRLICGERTQPFLEEYSELRDDILRLCGVSSAHVFTEAYRDFLDGVRVRSHIVNFVQELNALEPETFSILWDIHPSLLKQIICFFGIVAN